MKILFCHNFYQQRGGEDKSFEDEVWLLEQKGHQVIRYERHNDDIDKESKLQLLQNTVWNRECAKEVDGIIRRERPDVMHCTNTFPRISPSIHHAAHNQGVPVVQSLRNYRLLCPAATFLRDGNICESCLQKNIPWPAITHGCYRGSRAASSAVVAMISMHRFRKTWSRCVDRYYTLTNFARDKFIQGGLDADKIDVKENFVRPDLGPGSGQGGYFTFVGRLSAEKGIETLLSAWNLLEEPVPLKIVGDGPLADRVQEAAAIDPRIKWLGRRNSSEVLSILGEAECLVMPSIWYETFGRTIAEAFSRGTPVIASRLGAMADLLRDGRNGLQVNPGDAQDLADKVSRLWEERSLTQSMRLAAREEFEQRFTAEENYLRLIEIYEKAIGSDIQTPGVEAIEPRPGDIPSDEIETQGAPVGVIDNEDEDEEVHHVGSH